jgi:rhodanese-related sulfurtransferase
MSMKTPQRLLAIVGSAFLLGTGHSLVTGKVSLGPANLTAGTEDVKGDPNRGTPDATPADPSVEDTEDSADQPSPIIEDEPVVEEQPMNPTTSFAGKGLVDLDAPVPEGSLTLRESHELWDMGAYFLDARHDYEFEAGHIQYAAWLPAQLFDTDSTRAFAIMDTIPKDGTIVIYCVGGECDASKNTAARLEQFGYEDLRIMGAGYEDWVNAGFPTATGADDGMGVSP